MTNKVLPALTLTFLPLLLGACAPSVTAAPTAGGSTSPAAQTLSVSQADTVPATDSRLIDARLPGQGSRITDTAQADAALAQVLEGGRTKCEAFEHFVWFTPSHAGLEGELSSRLRGLGYEVREFRRSRTMIEQLAVNSQNVFLLEWAFNQDRAGLSLCRVGRRG